MSRVATLVAPDKAPKIVFLPTLAARFWPGVGAALVSGGSCTRVAVMMRRYRDECWLVDLMPGEGLSNYGALLGQNGLGLGPQQQGVAIRMDKRWSGFACWH